MLLLVVVWSEELHDDDVVDDDHDAAVGEDDYADKYTAFYVVIWLVGVVKVVMVVV